MTQEGGHNDKKLTLLVATLNEGKRLEIDHYLADLSIQVLHLGDLDPLPECVEDKSTFLENALKKSKHFYRLTRLLTLSDDSGLMIDALDGLPGIRSARFAGANATDAQRVQKILRMMQGIPKFDRTASFTCALAVSGDSSEVFCIEETVRGVITLSPKGSQGFGYDSIFEVPEIGKTFAELSEVQKTRISHRGKALSRLREFLNSRLGINT